MSAVSYCWLGFFTGVLFTSLVVRFVPHWLIPGVEGARWCRKCWTRLRIIMDGDDVCLECGDRIELPKEPPDELAARRLYRGRP